MQETRTSALLLDVTINFLLEFGSARLPQLVCVSPDIDNIMIINLHVLSFVIFASKTTSYCYYQLELGASSQCGPWKPSEHHPLSILQNTSFTSNTPVSSCLWIQRRLRAPLTFLTRLISPNLTTFLRIQELTPPTQWK